MPPEMQAKESMTITSKATDPAPTVTAFLTPKVLGRRWYVSYALSNIQDWEAAPVVKPQADA